MKTLIKEDQPLANRIAGFNYREEDEILNRMEIQMFFHRLAKKYNSLLIETPLVSRVNTFIGPRPKPLHMRKFIGCLALALPVLTSVGYMLLAVQQWVILDSISEYYYTFMRDVFVGTLCMVGLFLYAYKGYNNWENRVFNTAAILCVLIAFYGMDPKGYTGNYPIVFNNHVLIAHHWYFAKIHLTAASILFIILGYVSNNLFTKTDQTENPGANKTPTAKKRQRNAIYHACGYIIWLSLLVYVIYSIIAYIYRNNATGQCMDNFCMLFCVEAVCLWAFGFSWLVKGEGVAFLND